MAKGQPDLTISDGYGDGIVNDAPPEPAAL